MTYSEILFTIRQQRGQREQRAIAVHHLVTERRENRGGRPD
jgi:hypothetical protein